MPGSRRASYGMRLWRQAVREGAARGIPPEERLAHIQNDIDRSIERSAEAQPWREIEWARRAEQDQDRVKAIGRREFIRRGAAAGAGAAAFSFAFLRAGSTDVSPRAITKHKVVVVGAGIAGMTAAYRLNKTRGIRVHVYEARNRTGGRTWSDQGTSFANGQHFEHGGGGINTNETAYLDFFQNELNMGPKVDTWLRYPSGGTQHFYGGSQYSAAQMGAAGLDAAATTANTHWKSMVWPARYNNRNAKNDLYDAMTAADWISQYCPGGLSGPAGKELALTWCGVEYAGVAADQSAIPIIMEIGGNWLHSDSSYNERWAVPGGNDQVAAKCASLLPAGRMHLNESLVAIKKSVGGNYTLTFDNGTLHDVVAEQVVIAMPPAAINQYTDYSQAGFGSLTNQWIPNVQAGTNSKINMQFNGQPWKTAGAGGDAMTDQINTWNWQASYLPPNATSVLIAMNNVLPAPADPAHAAISNATKNAMLASLDFQYANKCTPNYVQGYHDQWVNDPWSLGTYSYYRPGAFTNYAGSEWVAQGGVHFCGEHAWDGTAVGYEERGMMSSAYLTGERAASEVRTALGL